MAPPDYWHIHELGGYARWGHHRIGEERTWLTSLPPWQHVEGVGGDLARRPCRRSEPCFSPAPRPGSRVGPGLFVGVAK